MVVEFVNMLDNKTGKIELNVSLYPCPCIWDKSDPTESNDITIKL